MVNASLRMLCARLYREATTPNSLIPRGDGARSAVQEFGMAYHVTQLRRGNVPAPWWETTNVCQLRRVVAEREGRVAPSWQTENPLLLVHWPQLLSKARFSSGSRLRDLAFGFLHLLLPLIEQFDVTLAYDLTTFKARWMAELPGAMNRPLFWGQRDSVDEARFDRHLAALLRNPSFCEYLTETMLSSFQGYIATRQQHLAGLCPSKQRHFRGQSCETCKPLRWMRKNITILWPHLLPEVRGELRIVKPDNFDVSTDPWTHELRHWLTTDHKDEGIVRPTPDTLLVNFVELRKYIGFMERPTPLLTEFIRPWPADLWMQGFHTRGVVQQRLPGLEANRPKALKDLVEEAGWEWIETLDIPYELYDREKILKRLSLGKEARRHLALATPPSETRYYKLRVVYVKYTDPLGIIHDIGVHQRHVRGKLTNFYSLPYEPHARREDRRGVAIKINGTYFWSLYGVNRHARVDEHGQPFHSAAPHFRDWALEQDLMLDKDAFSLLRYESRYADRIAKKMRGEAEHIGRFTSYEDEALREFFAKPRDHRRLTRDEWSELLAKLPGRNQLSVTRRLEELGKEYALKYGWAAYATSPWCLRISPARRKRWIEEGVRP